MLNKNMKFQEKNFYPELCDFLNRELQIYNDLINEMKNKQKAIINQDSNQIKKSIIIERKKSQSILKQMELRNKLIQTFSKNKESNNNQITLTKLIEKANSFTKERLKDIRSQMYFCITEIDRINKENKYLLSASISQVKDLIKIFLTNGKKSHSHYKINGSLSNVKKDNQVLDYKV